MKQVEERYISLLTDFGFKRIFGTAMNKDLLICFLNSLLITYSIENEQCVMLFVWWGTGAVICCNCIL